MFIEECYIRSFGTFSDYLYRADRHMNAINMPNGSGKTTFAEFLKAMFYGMPSTGNKKNINDATRVKYMPWNGNSMGGYVIFSANGCRYKLERKFMKREKDDTFRLINLRTGEESHDFTPDIGEELFGVDERTFVSAAFVSQKNRRFIDGEKMISHIAFTYEGDEDLIHYGEAEKKLDDAYRFYVKTGGRGELARLHNELNKSRVRRDKLEKTLSDEEEYIVEDENRGSSVGSFIIILAMTGLAVWMFVLDYLIAAVSVAAIMVLYALIQIIVKSSAKRKKVSPRYVELSEVLDEEDKNIDGLEDEVTQAEYESKIILRTKELLSKSRAECISRYYESISEGLNKYISKFGVKYLAMTQIRQGMDISVFDADETKEMDYYSEGLQDVFSFCQKLSCMDLIFEGKEPPFLILDDPFVEMDDDTVQKGLEIISELSELQQVFYFTCQSGRMP